MVFTIYVKERCNKNFCCDCRHKRYAYMGKGYTRSLAEGLQVCNLYSKLLQNDIRLPECIEHTLPESTLLSGLDLEENTTWIKYEIKYNCDHCDFFRITDSSCALFLRYIKASPYGRYARCQDCLDAERILEKCLTIIE